MVIPGFTPLRSAALVILVIALLASTLSCGSSHSSSQQPSIGTAYAGPATMYLREDLAAKSAPIVEVKHGDRLDILETRRRLVRVRTAAGVEGWVDANLLLSAEQMEELRRMASGAEKFPSQGTATVFDALNVHTEPNRPSPSFAQIPEGGSVEVLAHRAVPRGASTKPAPLTKTVKPPAKPSKKDSKKAASLLPPPPAPRPPSDWQQMSRPRASDLPGYTPPVLPPPPPLEDWDLVRTKDGKVGWVLARMLSMAIPDDVAQYAEGQRITAYLAIGEVADGDQIKKNWLWTTASTGLHLADFDGIRVFVWSKSRHRYETAYIERNVTGYYPVQLVDIPGGKEKGFSLIARDRSAQDRLAQNKAAQDKDAQNKSAPDKVVRGKVARGKAARDKTLQEQATPADMNGALMKRTYAFSGYHVRLVSKEPVVRGAEESSPALDTASGASPQPAPATGGWWHKIGAWPRRWFSH